jgi:sulfatase modifying factor 1
MSAPDAARQLFPRPFPLPWASDWGEDDEHGLWMALTLGDARQVFRWIAPGRFLMGSPADEPERHEDEVQHEVTLSRGFWLADTACTQAFWQAVTGSNPSRFQGRPAQPGRAGELGRRADVHRRTEAPAAGIAGAAADRSGMGIRVPGRDDDAVLVRRQHHPGVGQLQRQLPLRRWREGLYRAKTVPVASLPANPWGLYEMHGNVLGMVRGLVWRLSDGATGRSTRSTNWRRPRVARRLVARRRQARAFRPTGTGFEPGYRYVYIGFRLALGPGEQGWVTGGAGDG